MKIRTLITTVFTALFVHFGFADGVVAPGTTILNDAASSGSIAEWTLDGNFTAPTDFTIGGSGRHYNNLTVTDGQTFSAGAGMVVGPANGSRNYLTVNENGMVAVTGNMRIGTGSISYYSTYSLVEVSGALNISGDLDISNGYNATENILRLNNGGITKVDGDFLLYNHWSYGNCWLELDGGILAVAGDQTAAFEPSDGIVTSIKIWDETSGSYQRVADFDAQTVVTNSYFDQLQVNYISDAGNPLNGYTVIRAIPEPMTLSLVAIFGGSILFFRRLQMS